MHFRHRQDIEKQKYNLDCRGPIKAVARVFYLLANFADLIWNGIKTIFQLQLALSTSLEKGGKMGKKKMRKISFCRCKMP
jgi:hypothetical protein